MSDSLSRSLIERLTNAAQPILSLPDHPRILALEDIVAIVQDHFSSEIPLLNPEMPADEIRLHMGEMTAQEMRTARAAIGWANFVAQGNSPYKWEVEKTAPAQQPDDKTIREKILSACESHQRQALSDEFMITGLLGDIISVLRPYLCAPEREVEQPVERTAAFEAKWEETNGGTDRLSAEFWFEEGWSARAIKREISTPPQAPKGFYWMLVPDDNKGEKP